MLSGDVELHPGPAYKSLNMCHVNIRSLSSSKLKAIELNLAGIYDIITISETHLQTAVQNDLFKLKGYHEIIRKDRGDLGGGVAIYVKENITYKRLVQYETQELEAVWLQIN
jgi:exonuclease III